MVCPPVHPFTRLRARRPSGPAHLPHQSLLHRQQPGASSPKPGAGSRLRSPQAGNHHEQPVLGAFRSFTNPEVRRQTGERGTCVTLISSVSPASLSPGAAAGRPAGDHLDRGGSREAPVWHSIARHAAALPAVQAS